MTLNKLSDKLIIGEQRNSQLIFPSVIQEFKLQRAAPRCSTSSSGIILVWILKRRGTVLWVLILLLGEIIRIISSFEAQPLVILPNQVLRFVLTLLGILSHPSQLYPSSGAASITPDLIKANEWEPAPCLQDPWAPATTHILPTASGLTQCGSHTLSPTQGREPRGISPAPRDLRMQPKVHLCPLPQNH